MRSAVIGLTCLLLPLQVHPTVGGKHSLAIAPVTAEQTLFIGDSITNRWVDEPVRDGYEGQQACVIRLHLAADLAAHPQVKRLVIEAGTNDIIDGPGGGFRCNLPGQDPVSAVLNMIRTGQAAGLEVFVLSVLPISWEDRAGQPCDDYVPGFNQTLQAAITAQGAYWVDDYDAFVGNPQLQSDGVHPTEAGYQVIEQVYAAAAAAAEGQ